MAADLHPESTVSPRELAEAADLSDEGRAMIAQAPSLYGLLNRAQ